MESKCCPSCGSSDVKKEYIYGQDTGDFVCNDCNHAGPRDTFFKEQDSNNEDSEH
jgi:transcription initiation factor TFIIIB Brf1 subunit/transcription initiation factor TFIIB